MESKQTSVAFGLANRKLKIIDTITGNTIHFIHIESAIKVYLKIIVWNSDSTQIATADSNGVIRIYNVDNSIIPCFIKNTNNSIKSIEWINNKFVWC